MTGAQVREARRLLGWTRDRLSGWCNISPSAIRTFEETGRLKPPQHKGNPKGLAERLAQLRSALEHAGVVFIDGDELGVKLRKVAE